MSTGLSSATGRLHCCWIQKSKCKRFCAFRLARGRRGGSLNDGSSKHTYGGALFVKDQIIPGTYFYEWVRELSNIPREHRLYDMYIYTLSFARGWFLQLPAGAYGHGLGTYFPRVSFMFIFLSSHFDSRILCAQLCPRAYRRPRASLIGHGSAQFRPRVR